MQLSAADIYRYYRPSRCEGRLYLRRQGVQEDPASPYQDVIRKLGERHEHQFLAGLDVVDLTAGDWDTREKHTREALAARDRALYQPLLRVKAFLDGEEHEVIGTPDIIQFVDGRCAITDCRTARRITETDHPEILRSMEMYGWLCERALGEPPAHLQVYSGTGALVDVPPADSANVEAMLGWIVSAAQAPARKYEPVGWSRCEGCCFGSYCWNDAEDRDDVSLIPDVDLSLARTLHDMGIESVDDLIGAFDEASLAELKRPWGKKLQKVGAKSALILLQASALSSGTDIWLEPPSVPSGPCVMLDFEGLPPQLDEFDKVYLWGMQVFGARPNPYQCAVAECGPGGDRAGWERFLAAVARLFAEHGDIPFVHWSPYERGKLASYLVRYGDRDGTAKRLQANLLDLLQVVRDAVVLPLPSYSLKVVERHVGFRRARQDRGGEWSMARYVEATESGDEAERVAIIADIADYNREDLEATWAVLIWLRDKTALA